MCTYVVSLPFSEVCLSDPQFLVSILMETKMAQEENAFHHLHPGRSEGRPAGCHAYCHFLCVGWVAKYGYCYVIKLFSFTAFYVVCLPVMWEREGRQYGVCACFHKSPACLEKGRRHVRGRE